MNNLDLKRTKVSLIVNIIIFILTIVALVIMFTGFKFMYGYETVLESTRLGMLRFFTVQSNLFMGIIALYFAVQEIKVLKGKTSEIPNIAYILKMMATTSVSLTFIVVFSYLGPIAKGGIPSMLMNSNLFFHLLIPVISIINFIVFEKNNKLKMKSTIYCMIPTLIYELYYLVNVIIHMENGKVSPDYDWYWFVQNGVWNAIIVAPMILGITYIISLILWKFNNTRVHAFGDTYQKHK